MSFNPKNVFDLPDLDVPIFRIFPLVRFEQAMKEQKLALVKPSSWEDPFENVLLKSKARISTNEVADLSPLGEKLYGQCWMLCPDSEAMWKLYSFPSKLPSRLLHRKVFQFNRWLSGPSNHHEGVKVRTTVRKLFDAFFDQTQAFHDLCYFIGKVEYLSLNDIDIRLNDTDYVTSEVLDSTGRGNARLLLVKRDAYRHEEEVRLIYAANDSTFDRSSPLYFFEIQPNTLFEEVILDPRLTEDKVRDTTQQVRSWGYQGPINQSPINQRPNVTVRLDV